MGFQKMYGFEGVCQSEVQVSIYELSVLGGPVHTSWSDLVGVRQLSNLKTGKQVFFQKNRVIKGIPYLLPPPLCAMSEGQKQSRNVCISTLYIKCDFYQTQPGSPRSDNCLVLLILSSMLILNL